MSKMTLVAKPGELEFRLTREIAAPRERVFKAMTDAALLPKWWGPAKYSTKVEILDARPGGMWRFVQKDEAGHEFAFHGVFHAIVAPETIVQTFEFEGEAGHVALDTTHLQDQNGKTLVIAQSVFQSVADRDGMIDSGMESGAAEGYDRLEALARG